MAGLHRARPVGLASWLLGAFALGAFACNQVLGIEPGRAIDVSPTAAGGGAGAGGEGGRGGDASSSAAGGGELNDVCGPSRCKDADYGAGGPCAATTLYESQGSEDSDVEATSIAPDPSRKRILWARGYGGQMVITPTNGGTSSLLVGAAVGHNVTYASSLQIAGGSLFWNSFYDGTLAKVALEGATVATRVAMAPGVGTDHSFALFGGYVFYPTKVSSKPGDPFCNETNSVCKDHLYRAPLEGTEATATLVFEPALPNTELNGVASDGTSLYFTTCEAQSGKLYRLTEPTGQPVAIGDFVTEDTVCVDVVAEPGSGGRVYWVSAEGIYSANKDGSDIGVVAPVPSAWSLAMDNDHLYWIEDFVKVWRKSKRASGQAVQIGEAEGGLDVAVDCERVYWTNNLGVIGTNAIELRSVPR